MHVNLRQFDDYENLKENSDHFFLVTTRDTKCWYINNQIIVYSAKAIVSFYSQMYCKIVNLKI